MDSFCVSIWRVFSETRVGPPKGGKSKRSRVELGGLVKGKKMTSIQTRGVNKKKGTDESYEQWERLLTILKKKLRTRTSRKTQYL